MNRRAIIGLIGTAALLGLAACAGQMTTLGSGSMAWAFNQNPDEGAKLAYGAPASDNVVLMMTCRPGSSRVALSAITTEKAPTGVTLISNGAKGVFRGASASGFEGQVGLVEAMAPASSAALKGFRQTGDLALLDGRHKVKIAAGDKDKAAVDRFFKACEAA
jgi:hypothetical protein